MLANGIVVTMKHCVVLFNEMSKQIIEVIFCKFFSYLHFVCDGGYVADPRASFLLPKAFQPLSFCFIYLFWLQLLS